MKKIHSIFLTTFRCSRFRSLKSSEQPPYLRAIARTLNSVFNVNEISNAYWNGDLLAEIDYRFETPSDDVFASLERSLRHDSAAILAPLGPEALGSAPASKSRRKKESRTGSVSSSYSSASSGYSNPDEDYATQSAPAPAPVAVKKSTSGRLIKQPQPFSGISVERGSHRPPIWSSFHAFLTHDILEFAFF